MDSPQGPVVSQTGGTCYGESSILREGETTTIHLGSFDSKTEFSRKETDNSWNGALKKASKTEGPGAKNASKIPK